MTPYGTSNYREMLQSWNRSLAYVSYFDKPLQTFRASQSCCTRIFVKDEPFILAIGLFTKYLLYELFKLIWRKRLYSPCRIAVEILRSTGALAIQKLVVYCCRNNWTVPQNQSAIGLHPFNGARRYYGTRHQEHLAVVWAVLQLLPYLKDTRSGFVPIKMA